MPSATAHDLLLDVFHKHGLSTGEGNGWIFPHPTSTSAIAATWHPSEHNGELLIQVCSGQDMIIESFAGIGTSGKGLSDAMTMFMITNLHVLLAALWDVNDESQVKTQTWSIGLQRYKAFTGPITSRMSGISAPPIPPDLEASLCKAVQAEDLTHGLHWFRFFFCNLNGKFTFEVLHNNEEWAAGRKALESLAWKKESGYYSARMFMMVRPSGHIGIG